MKKFAQEFKTFATKGNVFDLAVAVIIGGAFGKIVTSFVNDLFMPLLSLILGNTNLPDLKIILTEGSESVEELAIRYGQFIQSTIDFIIIAFVIFMMIKLISKFKAKEEVKPAAPVAPTKEEVLLEEIRDILKSK